MNHTQRTEMYDRIERHGRDLLAIFPDALERDPVKLCKKLRRIEGQAHKLAEDCCMHLSMESPEFEYRHGGLMAQIQRQLGSDRPWINLDSRGYALKVDLEPGERLHTDWGGNGIIAPDLSP